MQFLKKTSPFQANMLARASLLALMAAGFSGVHAVAQDAPDEINEDEDIDRADDVSDVVVITGSRIRRESFDQPLPTTTIGAEYIENRAFTNTIEALQDLPLVSVDATNQGQNTQFGSNFSFVDLFNLGSNRTLSLINGRRIVGANQATIFVPGNGPGAQVDLTVINPSLIERTEVVTVGGGPIYGADAVSGVVNLILKDDFEGLDFTIQGGITQEGDGEEYRVNGVWGKNFLDGRANLTISAEYLDQEGIFGASGRDFLLRDSAADTNPFNTGANDGIPNTLFIDNATSPIVTPGGTIVTAQNATGGTGTTLIIPNPAADPNIDPLLFFAAGAVNGTLPENPNLDPTTAALFPTIAVPLQFASNGDLLPYDIGAVAPGLVATFGTTSGGAGANNIDGTNLRSATERLTFNMLGRFDLTENVTFKQEFFWVDINQDSVGLPFSNSPFGSTAAGSRSIPIYVDQNPFLSAQALGVIAGLDGSNLSQIDPDGAGTLYDSSNVLFLARQLDDILVAQSGNRVRSWRSASVLEGQFEEFDRNFYWDVSLVYGKHVSENLANQLLDIEFALATDVVDDGNGNAVCRQQLTGPQSIVLSNPVLSGINSALSRTPTQAQIDACVPLNLFGVGNASQAAIDYVTTNDAGSMNESTQLYAAGSFGGELVELPAGPFAFNMQAEFRREALTFSPGPVFIAGAGRNTQGTGTEGSSRFIEAGFEGVLPIFGGDLTPFAFRSLELNGAVRAVLRNSETTNTIFTNPPGTTDITFTAGGTWRPFDQIQFRGNRTRSVRSAAIVELFGPLQTGFGGLTNPCAAANVDSGPNPAVRRANCTTIFQQIDPSLSEAEATALINNFQPASGVNFGFPAATGGQPTLANEVANNWTVGMVWEPSFIPNLTIAGDYVDIGISGQSGLVFVTTLFNDCVDSPNFPDVLTAGSIPACEQLVFGVPDGAGNFVVPSTTLTGGPLPPGAPTPGELAVAQAPGELAFGFFAQGNLGATSLNGITGDVRYNFALGDLGQWGDGFGDINLRGTVFFLRERTTSGNGTFSDANPNAGEHTDPKVSTRLDLTHSLGRFQHTLQWFRFSSTVTNVQTVGQALLDQPQNFAAPSYNTFNYNAAFGINDNFTLRLVVNNLLNNDGPFPQFTAGRPDTNNEVRDPLGRRFTLSLQGRF